MSKKQEYTILYENIEAQHLLVEEVIAEGLGDSFKKIGKSLKTKTKNTINTAIEKFIAGIASIFGKAKSNGEINKINSETLDTKLQNNKIINKLFGNNLSEIIQSCKSITKEDLGSVFDTEKINQSIENLPDNKTQDQITESIYNQLIAFSIINEDNEHDIDVSKYKVIIDPNQNPPVKITDLSDTEITDKAIIKKILLRLSDNSAEETDNPQDITDTNEIELETDSNSKAAAVWVVERAQKVLDILQFPYNKEKLQAYIAKKIDSFKFTQDGELKSKGKLFLTMLKWCRINHFNIYDCNIFNSWRFIRCCRIFRY